MTDVDHEFINPLLVFFDRPDAPDKAAFLDGLAEDLSRFSADTLRAAVIHLRQTRKFRTFPSIAECIAACRWAEGIRPKPAAPNVDFEKQVQREKARRIACHQIRNSTLADRADREEWLPALIDFVIREGRLPYGAEIGEVASSAQRARDGIHRVRDEAHEHRLANQRAGTRFRNDADLSPALAGLRRNMIEKARRDVFGPALARAAE